jgi:hypothetical protein
VQPYEVKPNQSDVTDILLNDATLKNEALALGLIKTTKEALSPANKVLAAQAAIYKQAADAQGDFGENFRRISKQSKNTCS